MICKKCGKTIADDSIYCNYCGVKVFPQKEEVVKNKFSKKDFDEVIQSIAEYDWSEAIAFAREQYPHADSIKFRVTIIKDGCGGKYDLKDWLCFESERDMKEGVIKKLSELANKQRDAISDFDSLDIHISTDVFFSKEHDENEPLFYENDILDFKIDNDAEGNSWISENCVWWQLGSNFPLLHYWKGTKIPNVFPPEPGYSKPIW